MADIEFPDVRVPKMGRHEHARYVPNHRSFGAFIKSDQMRDVTEEVAKDIAVTARGFVSEGGGENSRGLHDRVRGGFKVKRNAGMLKVGGNLRVKVTVVNDVEGSALTEFGARGLERDRALGRAGAMFGDFKPEGGPHA